MNSSLKVVIVGAGIGGLTCAIACRQQNLDVVVLERAEEFRAVGAGIQLPANATKAIRRLGLHGKLNLYGAIEVENHTLRSYSTGDALARKKAGDATVQAYGSEWMVIHRAEYHEMLLHEALRLGAEVRTNAEVVGVENESSGSVVTLACGETLRGDVTVAADGLWSKLRSTMGIGGDPEETGDLAYRGTFSAEQLKALGDPGVQELLDASDVQVWLGPHTHVVFYPVRNKSEYNLVLLCPDNLPRDVRTGAGSLDEMRAIFRDWDPRLNLMIAQLTGALKWKLCHFDELETWVQGSVALLGDACHPTLPYQAQGAAMAVEDGLVLGTLLGRLQSDLQRGQEANKEVAVHDVLKLYEQLRKRRTTTNTRGSVQCQDFYHVVDGDEQKYRDEILERFTRSGEWPRACKWNWGDAAYQKSLLGFDAMEHALFQYDDWRRARADGRARSYM